MAVQMIAMSTLLQLLWMFQLYVYAMYALDMVYDESLLRHYTFYYDSIRYDIPNWTLLPNQSLTISDDDNNTIVYNSSLILCINDDIIVDYQHNYHFNEVQQYNALKLNANLRRDVVQPSATNPQTQTQTQTRRRLRSRRKRRRRRKNRRKRRRSRRRGRRHKRRSSSTRYKPAAEHSHQREPALNRWLKHWKSRIRTKQHHHLQAIRNLHRSRHHKNRFAAQGRFVGYFYGDRRGSTFREARRYCRRKWGGLASINSDHENEQCKRVCRLLEGDTAHNGYYCWIGLYKPWTRWMDGRRAQWLKWATNQKHITDDGRYDGHDKCTTIYRGTGYWYHQSCGLRNGVICQKPHGRYVGDYIVIHKQYRYAKASKLCLQWYGTHLATVMDADANRAVRRACSSVRENAKCWIGLQAPFDVWDDEIPVKFLNWAPGEPNNGDAEACIEMYGSGEWNNALCRVHRYPVCNGKPLVDRMDNRERWRLIRQQYRGFRKKWAHNQQRIWMQKQRKDNRWFDRFKNEMLRRMGVRTRQRFDDNMRTKFFNAQFALRGQRKLGYEPLINQRMLNAMFYQKYGRFPPRDIPAWMKRWMKKFAAAQRRSPSRAMMMNGAPGIALHTPMMTEWHKRFYGDLDHQPYVDGQPLSVTGLNGLNRELKQIHAASNPMRVRRLLPSSTTNDDDDGDDVDDAAAMYRMDVTRASEQDRKCVLLANLKGVQECCIGADYIELKRFVRREWKDNHLNMDMDMTMDMDVDVVVNEYGYDEIFNVSDVDVDYVDYENWKYRKSVFVSEHKMLNHFATNSVGYQYTLIPNAEREVYAAQRFEIMPFPIKEAQCWYLEQNAIEICMRIQDDDDDVIQFRTANERTQSEWNMVHFLNDHEWDEVNRFIDDSLIEKCVHLFEMKVCVEVDIKGSQFVVIQLNIILTIHDDDDDDVDVELKPF